LVHLTRLVGKYQSLWRLGKSYKYVTFENIAVVMLIEKFQIFENSK